jgi:hypothetical protein
MNAAFRCSVQAPPKPLPVARIAIPRVKLQGLILTAVVFTKYFVSKISGPSGFESGKESCSDNMHWLRHWFSPRRWSFVIFALVLAAILVGAGFYSGIIKRRDLACATATVRRTFADKARLPEMRMERSTLEFQLAGLPGKFPILTNAALARDWSASVGPARLDPDVGKAWNSYWKRVSPLVLQADHSLEYFLALQAAYDLDVDQLAGDWSVTNKPAALLNLQTNKFGSLFTNPVYLKDRTRFEAAAAKITDDKTLALREACWTALVSATTNLNPKLCDYGRATLALETRSAEINRRLGTLTEQLRDLGELPEPATDERVEKPTVVHPPEPLTSRKFFKTYTPQPRDFVTIETATIIIGFLITLPLELRPRRWLKIGASMVLVYLGLLTLRVPVSVALAQRHESIFAFLGYLLPATFLAAIWTPPICLILARLGLHLIDSPGTDGSPAPNPGSASRAARQGNYHDALRLARAKLAQDHSHYETLVLKAKLHQQMNHKWRAKWTLKKALREPDLTKDQWQHVNHLLANLEDRTHACWKI